MKHLLALLPLLIATPAFASPVNFAVRVEKVWTEAEPLALKKCRLVTLEREWQDDFLASIAADYEFGESDVYGILRFGRRLDAEMNEGAIGLEYRFSLAGCPPSPAPPKAKAKRPPKKPCP